MKGPTKPPNIAALPVDDRGIPVPYFVERPGTWKPGSSIDFRVIDATKWHRAVAGNLCWCCGRPMYAFKAFLGGPLSAAQKLYGDPPSHRTCAEYALMTCPFLANPSFERREDGLGAGVVRQANVVGANPKVTALVVARSVEIASAGAVRASGVIEVVWWCQGRPATREEVVEAINEARGRKEIEHIRDRVENLLDGLPMPYPGAG